MSCNHLTQLWQPFSCNIKKWDKPSSRDCNQKLIANLAQLPGPVLLKAVSVPNQSTSVPTTGPFAEDSGLDSGFLPTTSVPPEIPKQKGNVKETKFKKNFNNMLTLNGC